MHIFGKGGDGGEGGQQGYPDRGERAKIDACCASRVRRALQCDLATVLLKSGMLDWMVWPWIERFPVMEKLGITLPENATLQQYMDTMWETGKYLKIEE